MDAAVTTDVATAAADAVVAAADVAATTDAVAAKYRYQCPYGCPVLCPGQFFNAYSPGYLYISSIVACSFSEATAFAMAAANSAAAAGPFAVIKFSSQQSFSPVQCPSGTSKPG